jgi:S1-C subfamily serine protease
VKYLLIFATLLLVSCHNMYSNEATYKSYLTDLTRKTVRVERTCIGLDGYMHYGGYGSGVILKSATNKSLVVTAKHVIDEPLCVYEVVDYRNKRISATVKTLSDDGDMGVLVVNENLNQRTEVDLQPYLGQTITCVGFPASQLDEKKKYLSITKGSVSTLWVRDEYIRVSADLYFGSSGGGCFSDQGKLLGVVSLMFGAYVGDEYFPQDGQYFLAPSRLLFPVN